MKKYWIALLATMILIVSGCPTEMISDDIIDVDEFLPNNGGKIGPFEPFERTEGLYGMLLVNTVDRKNYLFSPYGTYFEVVMTFSPPESIEANYYTLEYALEKD